MTVAVPTLSRERRWLKEYDLIVACDEVGRGALAGPVAVGVALCDAAAARRRVPDGLRDSKLVVEHRRPEVAARARAWSVGNAVGWASSAEVDAWGIMRALGTAALRGIDAIRATGIDLGHALVVLDGNHDYITPAGGTGLTVLPVVKADRDCASVAAASVVAKVERDALMRGLHDEAPVYQWDRNKGYASAEHREAIAQHGLSVHHRSSWAIAAAPTLF